jgi:nuclear transport factor 2 (NTF2) superfamily protein
MAAGDGVQADQGGLGVHGRPDRRPLRLWHDDSGNWYRAHGNEQWEFDKVGLMRRREASINDVRIAAGTCKFHWPLGPQPEDHPELTDLGL